MLQVGCRSSRLFSQCLSSMTRSKPKGLTSGLDSETREGFLSLAITNLYLLIRFVYVSVTNSF